MARQQQEEDLAFRRLQCLAIKIGRVDSLDVKALEALGALGEESSTDITTGVIISLEKFLFEPSPILLNLASEIDEKCMENTRSDDGTLGRRKPRLEMLRKAAVGSLCRALEAAQLVDRDSVK